MNDGLLPDLRAEFTREHKQQAVALRLEGATIAETARIAGVSASTVSRHLRDDERFRERWDEATRICKEERARKAHRVVTQILDDPEHKDRLAAAKSYLGAYDEDFRGVAENARPDDGRADQIAEALDRFTATVVALAAKSAPEVPAAAPSRAELAAGEPH